MSVASFAQQIIRPENKLRTDFLDLCKKMLAFDPVKRMTVGQAIQHPYINDVAPDAPTQADVEANGGSVFGSLRGCPPTLKHKN